MFQTYYQKPIATVIRTGLKMCKLAEKSALLRHNIFYNYFHKSNLLSNFRHIIYRKFMQSNFVFEREIFTGGVC